MARLVDLDRRTALLDEVIAYLSEHGLADVSLRPLANALGVSVNTLVHHFGSKEDLVVAALRRTAMTQKQVEDRWLERNPGMSQADLLRAWWRWINASAQNLAIVRLGIEAAAMEATSGGLPRQVRGEQIGLWRINIEDRLIAEGMPRDAAVIEASLAKAMFTGLVVDLLATGQRARLSRALEVGLARLEQVVWSSAGLSDPQFPAATRHRDRHPDA
jgi:AcrR family transcriptional regulator